MLQGGRIFFFFLCQQLIRDTGGLKQLVALITDTPAPEDEVKKDKKSISRVVKKGTKDSK